MCPPPYPLTFLKQNGVWGLVPSGVQGQSPGLLLKQPAESLRDFDQPPLKSWWRLRGPIFSRACQLGLERKRACAMSPEFFSGFGKALPKESFISEAVMRAVFRGKRILRPLYGAQNLLAA